MSDRALRRSLPLVLVLAVLAVLALPAFPAGAAPPPDDGERGGTVDDLPDVEPEDLGPVEVRRVPREVWNAIVEAQPRGVVLGLGAYRELLADARAAAGSEVVRAPREARIERIVGNGGIQGEVCRIGLSLTARAGGPGWRETTFRIPNARVRSVDEAEGTILVVGGDGTFRLLCRGPARPEVRLEVETPFPETDGVRRLDLGLPDAPARRLSLTVPGDVEVASASGPALIRPGTAGGQSVVRLDPGSTGPARLTLRPRVETSPREPWLGVDQVADVTVRPGITVLRADLRVEVRRATVRELALSLDESWVVRSLTDPTGQSVDGWRRDGDALRVVLDGPRSGWITVRLEAEKLRIEPGAEDLPDLRLARAAERMRTFQVRTPEGYDVRLIEEEGVERIRPSDREDPPARIALRTAEESFRARVNLVEGAVRFRVDGQTRVHVDDPGLRTTADLALRCERGRLFGATLRLPAGWDPVSQEVRGPGEARLHRTDDGPVVAVDLPDGLPAGARRVVRVVFRRDRPADEGAVPLPEVRVDGASAREGTVLVSGSDPWRVELEDIAGLERLWEPPRGVRSAWRRTAADPTATVAFAERSSVLRAHSVSRVDVNEGEMRTQTRVSFEVVRGAVRELDLRIEPDPGDRAHIEGPDGLIAERRRNDDGSRTIVLSERRTGRIELTVDAARSYEPGEVRVPLVRCPGAVTDPTTVVVRGVEPVKVGLAETPGFRSVEARAVPGGTGGGRVLHTLAATGEERRLVLGVERFDAASVRRAICEERTVDVIRRDGGTRTVRATFRARATGVPLLGVRLPELPGDRSAELLSLTLDGEGVRAIQDGRTFLCPLERATGDRVRTIVCDYRLAWWDESEADLPVLVAQGEEVPVLSDEVTVHVPPRSQVLETGATNVASDLPAARAPWALHLLRTHPWTTGLLLLLIAGGGLLWPVREAVAGAVWGFLRAPATGNRLVVTVVVAVCLLGFLAYLLVPSLMSARRSAGVGGGRMDEAADAAPPAEPMDGDGAAARTRQAEGDAAAADDEMAVEPSREGEQVAQAGEERQAAEEPPTSVAAVGATVQAGLRSLVLGPLATGKAVTFSGVGAGRGVSVVTRPDATHLLLGILCWLAGLGLVLYGGLWDGPGRGFAWTAAVVIAASLAPVVLGASLVGPANGLVAGAVIGLVGVLIVRGVGACRGLLPGKAAAGAAAAGLVGLVCLLGTAGPVHAQDRDEVGPPGSNGAGAIYLPYDRGERPGEPRASDEVYVPMETYRRLRDLQEARALTTAPAPLGAVVREATYEARLGPGTLEVEARLTIDCPDEARGLLVDLGLRGTAVRSARLDGREARIRPGEGGFVLRLPSPGEHELELSFALEASREGRGTFDARTTVAAAPAATLSIDAPDSLEVSLPGTPQADDWATGSREVALGGASELRVAWRSRIAREDGATVLDASGRTLLAVGLGSTRVVRDLRVDVRAGATDRVAIGLPDGVDVVDVAGRGSGPSPRAWDVRSDARGRALVVALERPARNVAVRLRVEAAVATGTGPRTVEMPALPVLGARREQGLVGVALDPALEGTYETEGLQRAGAGGFGDVDVPGDLRLDRTGVFRRAGETARLVAEVDLRAASLEARVRQAVLCEPGHASVEGRVAFRSLGRPTFRLAIRVPEGYRISSLDAPWVAEHWQEEDLRILDLNEGVGAEWRTVDLRLEGPGPSEGILDLPLLSVPGVASVDGQVRLLSRPGTELGIARTDGLEQRDVADVAPEIPVRSPFEPRIGFRWTRPDATGRIAVDLDATEVRAEVLQRVIVGDTGVTDVLRVDVTIEGRPTAEVRLTLPARLDEGRVALAPAGDVPAEVWREEPAEGRAVWVVRLLRPRTGKLRLVGRVDEAAIGDEVTWRVPVVGVVGATDLRTRVGLEADPFAAIQVRPTAAREARTVEAEEIEDLPRATHAWEASGTDWEIAVRRTAVEEETGPDAVCRVAGLRTVVLEDGTSRTEARYLVTNRCAQHLAVALPEGASLVSTHVDGEPVRAGGQETDDGRSLLRLPLPPGGPLARFVLAKVVYEVDAGRPGPYGSFRPGAPEVLEVEVGRTFWTLWLPEDRSYPESLLGGNLRPVREPVALAEARVLTRALPGMEARLQRASPEEAATIRDRVERTARRARQALRDARDAPLSAELERERDELLDEVRSYRSVPLPQDDDEPITATHRPVRELEEEVVESEDIPRGANVEDLRRERGNMGQYGDPGRLDDGVTAEGSRPPGSPEADRLASTPASEPEAPADRSLDETSAADDYGTGGRGGERGDRQQAPAAEGARGARATGEGEGVALGGRGPGEVLSLPVRVRTGGRMIRLHKSGGSPEAALGSIHRGVGEWIHALLLLAGVILGGLLAHRRGWLAPEEGEGGPVATAWVILAAAAAAAAGNVWVALVVAGLLGLGAARERARAD